MLNAVIDLTMDLVIGPIFAVTCLAILFAPLTAVIVYCAVNQ